MVMRLSAESVVEGRLRSEQVDQWRKSGYLIVNGLIDAEHLQKLAALADTVFPEAGDPKADAITDFGSDGALVFPSQYNIFNDVTLDAALLQAVADLLRVPMSDIRLSQSDMWPKYGRASSQSRGDNRDQRIHVDYPNHSMLHPPAWDSPEAVELMIYYSDARDCGGETRVVPKLSADDDLYRYPIVDSPGIGELLFVNDRVSAESYLAKVAPESARFRQKLYAREAIVDYRPFDILFYRHDTWHRGTPLKVGSRRLAQNVTFRLAGAEWVSTLHPGWAWSAYRPTQFFEKWLARASVDQRGALGFPLPGSAYWTKETVAAVTARYGGFGFDPGPYEAALNS